MVSGLIGGKASGDSKCGRPEARPLAKRRGLPSPAPLVLIVSLVGCATSPYTTPVAEVRPIGGIYHEVKAGETLWRISRSYGIDLETIVKANYIEDTSLITRGQRLFIPGVYRKREEARPLAREDSFVWPVSGTVISFFGTKVDRVRNKGIDIRARMGTNVRASRSGRVVFCDDSLKGFGKTVILEHDDNYQTVYAYNSIIFVKVGEIVEQERVIARAGRTGRAKEVSLHFEIRKNGEPQNPFYYLPR